MALAFWAFLAYLAATLFVYAPLFKARAVIE